MRLRAETTLSHMYVHNVFSLNLELRRWRVRVSVHACVENAPAHTLAPMMTLIHDTPPVATTHNWHISAQTYPRACVSFWIRQTQQNVCTKLQSFQSEQQLCCAPWEWVPSNRPTTTTARRSAAAANLSYARMCVCVRACVRVLCEFASECDMWRSKRACNIGSSFWSARVTTTGSSHQLNRTRARCYAVVHAIRFPRYRAHTENPGAHVCFAFILRTLRNRLWCWKRRSVVARETMHAELMCVWARCQAPE